MPVTSNRKMEGNRGRIGQVHIGVTSMQTSEFWCLHIQKLETPCFSRLEHDTINDYSGNGVLKRILCLCRWACATIERGYSPAESRELRAIASFHHPLGFVYGYVRMVS